MDKVPVTLVDQIKAMPDVQVEEGLVPDVVNIGFNANPKKTTHRELLDPVVKNAMAHAVNRDKIIETVYNGRAAPAASILTPIAGDYLDPTIEPEAYDLALANQLLDDAGYTKGADGIRTTPAGDRMSYEVILPTDIEGQQRKFEIIQEDWKAIGIETVGKPMDGSAAWDAMMAPDGKYLEFDLHMWSWLGYIDPDFMLMTVMCDQYGNWSDTGYCNPEYDALYAQQAAEMDPAKRVAIVHEMQQILYRDHPYIFVAQSEFIRPTRAAGRASRPPIWSTSRRSRGTRSAARPTEPGQTSERSTRSNQSEISAAKSAGRSMRPM
jgi:peptide/nickel transport system substrate-binding protein